MVQYVLKRYATGSTITVDASDSVNHVQAKLDKMIRLVATLKILGEDQEYFQMDDTTFMLPQEAVDEAKEILMEVIKTDLFQKLCESGDGWGLEDLIIRVAED
jgi:hypothetical protein